jgi:hypothetical protein
MNWIKRHKFILWVIHWSVISIFGLVCLLLRITPGAVLLLFGLVMLIKEIISNNQKKGTAK